MSRCGETEVEGHLSAAESIVEMLRRSREDVGVPAADLTHGTVGHDVADLVGNDLATIVDHSHRIAGVLRDQPAGIVERQRDSFVAERIALVLPAKVLEASRRVRESAREKVQDLLLVARAERAAGKARVNGHASARRSGSPGS